MALSQKGAWVHLYDVSIDDTTIIYLTDFTDPIFYNSHNYVPYPIRRDDIEETSKPEMKTFTLTVPNIDRQMAAYLEAGQLLGQSIKITWVFLKDV